MKSCGKRLFTPACKAPRPRIGAEERGSKARAVRWLPGRSFFCLGEIFCFVVEGCFFRGFLRKRVFWCGVFVVKLWWIAW